MTTLYKSESIINDAFNFIKETKKQILKAKPEILKWKIDGYKKEFSTIKLLMPRRMGNTTLAVKCLKSFRDSVLFVYNMDLVKCVTDNFRLKKGVVYSSKCTKHLRGHDVKVIIVDNATYMTEKELSDIYNIQADVYILIG